MKPTLRDIILILLLALGIIYFSRQFSRSSLPEKATTALNANDNQNTSVIDTRIHPAQEKNLGPDIEQLNAKNKNSPEKSQEFKKYKEAFTGLNAYDWFFSYPECHKPPSLQVIGALRKLKIDPYEGQLTKLVDLKKGMFLRLTSLNNFKDLRIAANKENTRHIFQTGKLFFPQEYSKLNRIIPVCTLETKNEELEKSKYNHENLLVEKIEHPKADKNGLIGIEIFFSQEKTDWITSIECYANPALDYKQLQVLHLFATLGVHGSLHNK